MSIAGVILAGGNGSRLGHVLKADIEIAGRTMLARVRDRFTACAPLLLSTGPHDPTAFRDADGMVPVPDLPTAYGGPLAGVVAAVAWLIRNAPQVELLLTSACDSPLLPPDYLERLLTSLGDAPGLLAASGDSLYPTNSLWRVAALAPLVDGIRDGTAPHSMKRHALALGAATCSWDPAPLGDPFANANTPEELAALAAKLGSST